MPRRIFALAAATTSLLSVVACNAPPRVAESPAPDASSNLPPLTRDVSERPLMSSGPLYPVEMLRAGRTGSADIACDVTLQGVTENCAVVQSIGGEAFGQAALEFVSHARYKAAERAGVPVAIRHKWTIRFELADNLVPLAVAAALATPLPQQRWISDRPIAGPRLYYPDAIRIGGKEGTAQVECTVTVKDVPKDCRLTASAGDPTLDAAAMSYIANSAFESEVRNGVAVEASHSWPVAFRVRDLPPR